MVNYAAILSTIVLGLAATTSAAPYKLEARDVSCMDNLPGDTLANINEAVECINYLASLGGQACEAYVGGTSFCRRGNTQITGLAKTGHVTTTSTCQEVAQGLGQVMDRCSRGDGTVRGQNEAWGNGDMLVDIRRVVQ
ncbi:uncharacterized protein B0I36DRAFT_335289 [Microdochium trichocladiopsis]|uniref:Uncharacterized protein n=1 Tax=Microdochium trichocladiopsis TaxID=1682393 RepID=A0A9P9BJH2_9PEZI|nr:uncharacterized protein B0I36DRAFT_335289 [Microdochium trichocladiopsis]KAH7018090.1 hypothetical protein B0I36DRAFT_335289 [Microdochium trichocladiopsis]